LVQLVSGAGFHGRRRSARHRSEHRRHRGDRAPGARRAAHGWPVRRRDRLGDPAGRLLQAAWETHLQDGAHSSPLRAQGLGRAEGHRAVLDHLPAARAAGTRYVEVAMSTPAVKTHSAVIVGLGRTGLSCARYLRRLGWSFAVTDTRERPPELAALRELDPTIPVRTGGLDASLLGHADCVVVSPGISLAAPFFAEARERGLEVVGDIERS